MRVLVDIEAGNPTVGLYGGIVYAVIGDSSKMIPLLEVEGIDTTRCEPLDGAVGYRGMNRELAY